MADVTFEFVNDRLRICRGQLEIGTPEAEFEAARQSAPRRVVAERGSAELSQICVWLYELGHLSR